MDMFCRLETILKIQDQLVNNLQQLDALMTLYVKFSTLVTACPRMNRTGLNGYSFISQLVVFWF